MSYKILRFFRRDKRTQIIRSGLTLEEARAHCDDPDTSSRYATSSAAKRRTRLFGPWFDGYEEEDEDKRVLEGWDE